MLGRCGLPTKTRFLSMGSTFLEQIQPEFVLGNKGQPESVDPGLEYIGCEESRFSAVGFLG
jgi:hypothetical protein